MVKDLFVGIALVAFGTILGAFGAFFLKIGSNKINSKKDLFNLKKSIFLILGAGLYGISTIPFTFALKFGDLSILYPIVSLSYIWATILSITFLHERVNSFRWMGIAFIILGIVVISLGA